MIEEIYQNELPIRVLNHESSGERARYFIHTRYFITYKVFHIQGISYIQGISFHTLRILDNCLAQIAGNIQVFSPSTNQQ